ncbi:MAG: hypothetical protein HC837_17275 [Chloroflexaceae bacterium]|nr:hypothetical protein [Chloroflexaceae bacterium]
MDRWSSSYYDRYDRNRYDREDKPTSRSAVWVWVLVGTLAIFLLVQVIALAILIASPTARARFFAPFLDSRAPAMTAYLDDKQETTGSNNQGATLPAPPDAPDSSDQPATNGRVLIRDDFDQPTERWDQSQSQLVDGAYELRVAMPNNDSYGLFLGNMNIRDIDMAVDVQQVSGDPTAEFGIRFRQDRPDAYLMFSISGSGYYRLVRVEDETYTALHPWTFDRRINTGPDAVNRLRMVAEGSSLRGYINEQLVVEATDEQPVAGQLTLGAATFDEGDLVVQFDTMSGQASADEPIDLEQDFSTPANIPWSVGGARLESDAYEIFASGGIQTWQKPLPDGSSDVTDFALQVDMTVVDATGENAAYGILFGDEGGFEFYQLLLFADGRVGLLGLDREGRSGWMIPPTQLGIVNTAPGTTNAISIEVRERVIQITVNDTDLPEVTGVQDMAGMVGLIIQSDPSGEIRVRFDNFYLEELIKGEAT